MSKYLIINCDDFGQSKAANEAIIQLLEEGVVSSATIMPPAPAFEEAADWSRRHGRGRIGLHLTFTSEFAGYRWGSLTGSASLRDGEGYLPLTVHEFEIQAAPKDVKAEMLAQFTAVRRAGIEISHADNHMGSLYGLETGRSYLPMVLWQCSRRRIPFRLCRNIYDKDTLLSGIPGVEATLAKIVRVADLMGVPIPDYLLSHPYTLQEGETYDTFKSSLIQKLYELPYGVSETYIHPAVHDPQMLKLIPSWEKRVWEYRLMLDGDFSHALKDARVELTDYHYVKTKLRRSRAVGLSRFIFPRST
ncbi:polysaccharide deacetylase family protein [Paenibacillus sp. J22TS3]|uniref:polysaccharide deacetylase family protein n=1 Tax=Paenibacillus sp. J22TS3 TaxID=2807192 RepID=UPI001B153480|nr:polysaccharide deacetylase family protein [Paenibacillus sp. J22TS3]GIP23801.1 hypothetical protein J22TS3_40760 [Paenibacillus sp. J22TS3]